MRLIINCSTLSASGVTQVAVSFIYECLNFKDNEYHVFISKMILKQINITEFPGNFIFYNFDSHPLYGLEGFKMRKNLRNLELKIKPDCVFSVFGPSWWTPKSPHLMGYAYPYYVYPNSPLFDIMTKLDLLKIYFLKKIHIYFLGRNGKYLVSETEDVSNRLIKLLGFKSENVFTASNTYNTCFNNFVPSSVLLLPLKKENEFRFLSLCTYSLHKNLTILNKVIPLLNKIIPENKIRFILTIDPKIFVKKFDLEIRKSIINIGRIDVDQCPQIYHECDALFLPTTLECFSANYAEAMKMKKPIITSDLSFATTICNDGALYFDPFNEKAIVDVIKKIVESPSLRESLVLKGQKNLQNFLTPLERAEKYMKICQEIVLEKNSEK